MRSIQFLPLIVAIAFGLPACKIEKTIDPQTAETDAGQIGGADPIAALARDTFQSQLVALIAQRGQNAPDLRSAVAAGLDAAGAAFGHRGAGEGAAWNFAVKGEGVVIAANLESRARKAEIDIDGDGAADVTLQLGPVINGTALRDIAPFYNFGDFRDQIEFAQLARALNDLASAGLVLPDGDIVGKRVSFQGAMPLKSAGDAWAVTVISVAVAP